VLIIQGSKALKDKQEITETLQGEANYKISARQLPPTREALIKSREINTALPTWATQPGLSSRIANCQCNDLPLKCRNQWIRLKSCTRSRQCLAKKRSPCLLPTRTLQNLTFTRGPNTTSTRSPQSESTSTSGSSRKRPRRRPSTTFKICQQAQTPAVQAQTKWL